MNLEQISIYDLYFFGPIALDTIRYKLQLLDPYMQNTLGPSWYPDLDRAVDRYRYAVERCIQERNKTGPAVQEFDKIMNKVNLWRDTMVNIARQAPPQRRRLLLQSTGFGLGSPRSGEEMKDFLLEVQQRMELHSVELRSLGATARLMDFPGSILSTLQLKSSLIDREKSEEILVRHNIREQRNALVDRLTRLSNAASAATGQAILFEEEQGEALMRIEIALDKALGEARVNARRTTRLKNVPTELVAAPTAETVMVTGGEAPVSVDPMAGSFV